MATAIKQKVEKVLTLVARATFKKTGRSLYRIQSDVQYLTTLDANGVATGCDVESTGEPCKGFYYHGHCHHADFAMSHYAEAGAVGVVKTLTQEEEVVEIIEALRADYRAAWNRHEDILCESLAATIAMMERKLEVIEETNSRAVKKIKKFQPRVEKELSLSA